MNLHGGYNRTDGRTQSCRSWGHQFLFSFGQVREVCDFLAGLINNEKTQVFPILSIAIPLYAVFFSGAKK